MSVMDRVINITNASVLTKRDWRSVVGIWRISVKKLTGVSSREKSSSIFEQDFLREISSGAVRSAVADQTRKRF